MLTLQFLNSNYSTCTSVHFQETWDLFWTLSMSCVSSHSTL